MPAHRFRRPAPSHHSPQKPLDAHTGGPRLVTVKHVERADAALPGAGGPTDQKRGQGSWGEWPGRNPQASAMAAASRKP